MKTKQLLSLLLCFLLQEKLLSQVNLKDGSFHYQVPVYNYKDPGSPLGINITLNYTSGQGLKVDQLPSSIGQGWELGGLGAIIRVQKGQPDDQYPQEANWFDINNPAGKYPPGYLYNPRSVEAGCPYSLTTYPLFASEHVGYFNFNEQEADKELDEFIYSFNGHEGSFVLDKQQPGNVILVNDARLKIVATLGPNEMPATRTTITKFTITDEMGIQYEFGAVGKSRSIKYQMPVNTSWYVYGTEAPLSQKPYVANSWSLTKISEPGSGRMLRIDYTDQNIVRPGKYNVQLTLKSDYQCMPNVPNGCLNPDCVVHNVGSQQPCRTVFVHRALISEIKPEPIKITLPDNSTVDFTYGEIRADCPGGARLASITTRNITGERLLQLKLNQQYFIKNTVADATAQNSAWARLCLNSITQYGKTDSDHINPVKFEYYLGENNTENFVPPVYFHAQDPWGYYNGDSSGVTVNPPLAFEGGTTNQEQFIKLATYNNVVNAEYPGGEFGFGNVYANCKINYARNGLLKKITNAYGGTKTIEYEQNSVDGVYNKRVIFSRTRVVAPSGFNEEVVGGVHVSKQTDDEGNNPVITTYTYRDENGRSTLWGIEQPKNMRGFVQVYEPKDRYFEPLPLPGHCDFRNKYVGDLNYTQHFSAFESNRLTKGFLEFASTHIQPHLVGIFRAIPVHAIALSYYLWIWQAFIDLSNLVVSCTSNYSETNNRRVRTNAIENFSNGLPLVYAKVSVKKYSASLPANGKTVYEFTTEDDFPLLVPDNFPPFTSRPRCYPWNYGLPKSERLYDANNQLVKEVINTYNSFGTVATATNSKSCSCNPVYISSEKSEEWASPSHVNNFTAVSVPDRIGVEFYNIIKGRTELKSQVQKIYKNGLSAVADFHEYTYNPVNYLIAKDRYTNSKGIVKEDRTYYPEDYNLTNPNNSLLLELKNRNIVGTAIATESWQIRPGAGPELLAAAATEFGQLATGIVRPVKLFGLHTNKPLDQSVIGQFDPDKLIRNASFFAQQREVSYSPAGNLVQVKELPANRQTATLFGYGNHYPVAEIKNALVEEVAYTSFEGLDQGYQYNGHWDGADIEILQESCPTGERCCYLKPAPARPYITLLNGTLNQDYKLSCWADAASFTVNNGIAPVIKGPVISGWTYYEFDLPAGSPAPVITGNNCRIDELRCYPRKATMHTSTYSYGTGITSECDPNNRITYYQYDGMGRLSKVLDAGHNIIKTYEYHYKD